MIKVTVEQYAKHKGIVGRSVRRYLADGMIPESAVIREGKRRIFIDQEKADKSLENATTRKELLAVEKPIAEADMMTAATKAGTSGLSFHEARTLSQRYKAALLKIELEERTGKLIDAEKVKSAAFAQARTVRDALLNIPDRVSPILAAERDQLKVADLLTNEIRAALEILAGDLPIVHMEAEA